MSSPRSGSTWKDRPLPVLTSIARTPRSGPSSRTTGRAPPIWRTSPTSRRRSVRSHARPKRVTTLELRHGAQAARRGLVADAGVGRGVAEVEALPERPLLVQPVEDAGAEGVARADRADDLG